MPRAPLKEKMGEIPPQAGQSPFADDSGALQPWSGLFTLGLVAAALPRGPWNVDNVIAAGGNERGLEPNFEDHQWMTL
jgi:hypothetical protein